MVRVIGLMSGSSLDGLDIACVDFDSDDESKFELVSCQTIEYSTYWRETLSDCSKLDARSFLLLHHRYGEFLGQSVNKFLEDFGLSSSSIDLISSHGHTVFHEPSNRMTSQIGDGASIVAETRIRTVTELRSVDVAFGGQGAPIVPMGEKYLFKSFRFLLNIGGIANLSDQKFQIAFDVCPANRVLNNLTNFFANENFDRDGIFASRGKVHEELLEKLNQFEYYRKFYPKSLSNSFGLEEIYPVLIESKHSFVDLLRTYVEHIVEQVSRALKLISEREKQDISLFKGSTFLVTGGGGHNSFLVQRLSKRLLEEFSIELSVPKSDIIDFKEALIMAFLGLLRLKKKPNVLCSVTGAERDSIGGALWEF